MSTVIWYDFIKDCVCIHGVSLPRPGTPVDCYLVHVCPAESKRLDVAYLRGRNEAFYTP